MNLSITGRHLEVTASLKNYIADKISRLERHFENVANVHVILGVEKNRQKVEATINLRGANIFAESEDSDMYAAIDSLVDKLDRQVLKHKEKITKHHKRDKLPDALNQ